MKEIFLNSESVVEKIDYLNENFSKWVEEGSPMNIGFVFPIVVFEGSMYSAVFPLNRKNLSETSLVNYCTEYKSGSYKLYSNIDVVTKNYFTEYLQKITQDLNLIKKDISKNTDQIKNKISKKIGEKFRS